jgi:hypothetical protein
MRFPTEVPKATVSAAIIVPTTGILETAAVVAVAAVVATIAPVDLHLLIINCLLLTNVKRQLF